MTVVPLAGLMEDRWAERKVEQKVERKVDSWAAAMVEKKAVATAGQLVAKLEIQTAAMTVVWLVDRSAVPKVAMSAVEWVTNLAARLADVWVVRRVGGMDAMKVAQMVAWTAAKTVGLSANLMVGMLDKRSAVSSAAQMVT